MQVYITTLSPKMTHLLGVAVGKRIPAGAVIGAQADLGMGKTVFAQGLAEGLAVRVPVASPTYIYFEEYKGRHAFCHVDAYRLENIDDDELVLIGLEECFLPHKVTFVEWPQNVMAFLPLDTILMRISQPDKKTEARRFLFEFDEALHAWLRQALFEFAEVHNYER